MEVKPGTKPQGKVKIKWSPNFAYAIGLIATDGCLYADGRHISLTTKDLEQAHNFIKCLGLKVKIGLKGSGGSKEKKYYHIQFGDVLFYEFLNTIGITKRKSRTIANLKIPRRYFFDYLRGAFDGDGHFYSYWDLRWKSSFMYYVGFSSASTKHVEWLRSELEKYLGVKGHITKASKKICYQLRYAKMEGLVVIKAMYRPRGIFLKRKRLKIERALGIVGKSL